MTANRSYTTIARQYAKAVVTGKNATREADVPAFDDLATKAMGIQNVLG